MSYRNGIWIVGGNEVVNRFALDVLYAVLKPNDVYGVVYLYYEQNHMEPGFDICVSRTRNGARCLPMYRHQCSQAIPEFATKACELATKVELLQGLASPVP